MYSYFFIQELADAALQIIEEVEALGGMTKAIESGMAKLRIEEAATRKQVSTALCVLPCLFLSVFAKYSFFGVVLNPESFLLHEGNLPRCVCALY